jgi:hypothetical protein
MDDNGKTTGMLAAALFVVALVLWGIAGVLAPAAIIKWCWLFLMG